MSHVYTSPRAMFRDQCEMLMCSVSRLCHVHCYLCVPCTPSKPVTFSTDLGSVESISTVFYCVLANSRYVQSDT